MSSYPKGGWLAVLVLALGLAAWPAASGTKPTSVPLWQRLLRGEDARRAKQLQEQVNKYWDAAEFEQARKPAQELVVLRTKVQGADHWETVNAVWQGKAIDRLRQQEPAQQQEMARMSALRRQATALEAKGRAREALPLRQRILAVYRKLLGEDHPDTALGYHNLGHNQQGQGKYAEAEGNYQKALLLYRRLLTEDHPYTATGYNNLALNQNALAKHTQAERNVRIALEQRRKLLGEDNLSTATSYNNLAVIQYEQGKHAEAERHYTRALDLYRKLLSEEHTSIAASYNNLAVNQNAQGRYAEAERNYTRALDLCRKLLTEEHPHTATSYNNLALNQKAQGKYDEAERSAQKALDLRRKLLGDHHPHTASSYNNLAANQHDQGKYSEAERNYQKALAFWRKVLGEEHPLTATSLINLAGTQSAQGKYAEAERNNRKALDLFRQAFGEEHTATATAYTNLAANLHFQGKYREAEKLLGRAADAIEVQRLWGASSGLERALVRTASLRLPLLSAVLARNGKPVPAWQRLEQRLARGTWDDLAQRRFLTQQEVDRRALFRRQLELLDRQLEQLLASKDSPQREQRRKEILDQRLQARQALDELAGQLDRKHGPAVGKVFDLATIQKTMSTHSALICWIDLHGGAKSVNPGEEHWAVLVRHQGEPVWVQLPGSGAKQTWTHTDWQLAPDLRRALVDRRPWQPLAERLQKQRFTPLAPHLEARAGLPAVRHLIVLPSTYLRDVPVEVIAPRGLTVSYAPSGTLFAYLQQQPRVASRDLLAVADPIFEATRKDNAALPLPPGGLLLQMVPPGSIAGKAELRSGDVLLRYADRELKGIDDLTRAIADHAGRKEEVRLSIWRDGRTRTVLAAPGPLGVVLDREPAPKVLARRRQEQRQLAQARSADDGIWPELPGTRVEADGLRRLFHKQGWKVTLLCDSDASEQRLDGLARAGKLKEYRYLHLATHGELDDLGLLRSRLILSKDNLPDPDAQMRKGEPIYDGNLTAAEALLAWKLDADLVTLSACETALGKYAGGESYIGFPQALLLAGTRSVCVSLWKVNDIATALLMTRFYENLLGARNGLKAPLPKARALQEAKEWLKGLRRAEALKLAAEATGGVERGKRPALPPSPGGAKALVGDGSDQPYAHPYYWSGFILIGAPS